MGLFTSLPSLSDRMEYAKGRPAGFDYLRMGLALLILCFHSIVTSYGNAAQTELLNSTFGWFFSLLLPMFFALSGFLIAGSLEKSPSIKVFLGMRFLRIYPALIVDTLFCALVLGPLLTALTLGDYFSHSQFWQYLLNSLGWIHFYLPGVFENNPNTQVNGQLWTIPAELECYIVIALLGALGLHKTRIRFAVLVSAVLLALQLRSVMTHGNVNSGYLLVLAFLCGAVLFMFKDKVKWSFPLFVLATAVSFVAIKQPACGYLLAMSAAYITVYLGLFNPMKAKILTSGDYSYGIFLYGFPIQQALVATVPLASHWLGNIALAFPITFILAFVSWHVFEKKAVAQRPALLRVEAWMNGIFRSVVKGQ
jgi:peptidoglycan/LPS O-acetylase OafA/YrhL